MTDSIKAISVSSSISLQCSERKRTYGIVGRQFLVVSIPMSRLQVKRIHVIVARLVIGP